MQLVALVPGLLALIVALRRGPSRALLDVYLPVLLLLPDYFRWIAPGLPDPTMNEAAILPIAGVWLCTRGSRWRWSAGDVFVLGFAFMTSFTEYLAKGYADAQNLMFDQLGSVVLPYVLVKALVEQNGLRVAFAKRLVALLAVVSITSLYEFKMGRPLVRVFLDPFFPGQGSWVTTFRYGFARVAGPYGHAILAGVVLVAGFRIQRWLEWTGAWQGPSPIRGVSRGRLFTLVLALGVFITLVRGPLLGGALGAFVLIVARARDRRTVAQFVLAALLVVGVPTAVWFQDYVSVGREGAKTISQETAAYRAELIAKYTAIAEERAWFGWGRALWPKVAGMESTDNHYLLLALNHGLITLGLFLGITLTHVIRLGRFGARSARSDPDALLAFTFIGIYVAYLIALATVYHGMQSVQLFFIVAGWAEALLVYRGRARTNAARPELAPAALPRFRRMVA